LPHFIDAAAAERAGEAIRPAGIDDERDIRPPRRRYGEESHSL
jgi:hypothetical protein